MKSKKSLLGAFLLLVFCSYIEAAYDDEMAAILSSIWSSIKNFGNDIKTSVNSLAPSIFPQFSSLSEDVEKWDCGADKFWITKLITQRAAKSRCKSIFEEINKACRYHDFCYSNGLDGQQTCDDRFCSQLLSLKIADPAEQEACTLPRTMCDAVRLGGHLVYRSKVQRKK